MSELPKRTIDELKTRYFCEPSIYDIYVEGVFDKQLISSWCDKKGENKIVSYDINTVDVSFEILKKYNLTEGNKQRVIALAKELSQEQLDGYRCLVDKDLDHWLDKVDDVPNLIWTEYCSLELYYFKEDIIKRIIVEISSSKIRDWNLFYNSFVNILKSLYCMRVSDSALNYNIDWIDIGKYINSNKDILSFDSIVYIERNIIKNRLSDKKDIFIAEFNNWMQRIGGDPRFYVRGHDFTKMLSLVNKNFGGVKPFHDQVALERLLVALVDEVYELIESIMNTL